MDLIELTHKEEELLDVFRQLPEEEQDDIVAWIWYKLGYEGREEQEE